MTPLCVGAPVRIRRGDRGGQRAEVVEAQLAQVYKVKMPDGSFLFYSGRQLEAVNEQPRAPAARTR